VDKKILANIQEYNMENLYGFHIPRTTVPKPYVIISKKPYSRSRALDRISKLSEIHGNLKTEEIEVYQEAIFHFIAKTVINDESFIKELNEEIDKELLESLLVFIQDYVYNEKKDACIGDIVKAIEDIDSLWEEVKANNIFLIKFVDFALTKLIEKYREFKTIKIALKYLKELQSENNSLINLDENLPFITWDINHILQKPF
jgi:hypothetical protein